MWSDRRPRSRTCAGAVRSRPWTSTWSTSSPPAKANPGRTTERRLKSPPRNSWAAARPAADRVGGELHLGDAAARRVEVPDPQPVVELGGEQPAAFRQPPEAERATADDPSSSNQDRVTAAAAGLDRVRPALGEDAPEPGPEVAGGEPEHVLVGELARATTAAPPGAARGPMARPRSRPRTRRTGCGRPTAWRGRA